MDDFKKKLLKRKIMSMNDLPSMSSHIRTLITMLRDPDADIDDIIDEIYHDLTLVAQILKIINSSLYSLPNRVDSIEQAVSLVGLSRIWELLMSSTVLSLMSKSAKDLWSHSYTTSVFMKEFMVKEKVTCSANLPIVMLLHDIGKLVLITYNETSYRLVQRICMDERALFHVVEDKHMGVNHTEAGAWLLESWDIGERYSSLIRCHHNDLRLVPDALKLDVTLMQLADFCDNIARAMPYKAIDEDQLISVGLEGVSINDWTIRQRDIVFESTHMAHN